MMVPPRSPIRPIAPQTATGVEADVCDDIARRQKIGIAKYGTTVAKNPAELREWLQHAYEEALDNAIYLRRALREIDAQNPIRKPTPTDNQDAPFNHATQTHT